MARQGIKTIGLFLVVLMSAAGIISCATAGRTFSTAGVNQIVINQTTKKDIRKLFGPPWRTGKEDGMETWTYGYYRYNMFKQEQTTDLVVRFNNEGTVVSYSFSTTENVP